MKAYAEIKDHGRLVGIAFTRPSEQTPGLITVPRITERIPFISTIEGCLDWNMDQTPLGWLQDIACLPIEEVQTIFDALWKAGMRPSR
jgi:hypothetical protein